MLGPVSNFVPQIRYQFRDVGREILTEASQDLSEQIEQVRETTKDSINMILSRREEVAQVIVRMTAVRRARMRDRMEAARQQFEAMIEAKERRARRYRRITRERFSQISAQLLPVAVAASYYGAPIKGY
jgi:hypothetical protein